MRRHANMGGAHTIGVGHCNLFSNRLYNFTGKSDKDPSLNPTYAEYLKTQCTSQSDFTTTVPMDPRSSTSFDVDYFVILKKNMGLFQSDAALLTDQTASRYIDQILQKEDGFLPAFKNSVLKMGQIGVLTGTDGDIRKNCRAIN